MMNVWGFGGGGIGGFPAIRRFEEQYHCYSVAAADKGHLEKGDKILLPPSAFDTLARLQVDYPMLFRLSTVGGDRMTHSGVLEFTAEEGCCYIPFWMMQNLFIDEGSLLTVTNVSLPKATFVKLQPQSVDFLEISNPRAVLEHALRNYSCVTVGDVIQIPYNNKNYQFELKDVQPAPAACIIETDCNVDFDAPVGYKEPERPTPSSGQASSNATANLSRQSSGCPSPAATMSTTSSVVMNHTDDYAAAAASEPKGTHIVNGEIVRPDQQEQLSSIKPDMLASRSGQTGVQPNAAIPVVAPQVDYWALQAGDGARLDGKQPAALKDAAGNVIDIRQLRAEAAARRSAQQLQQQQLSSLSSSLHNSTGIALKDGRPVEPEQPQQGVTNIPAAPVPKRKSRVGSKYSKLKNSSAFIGTAQALDDETK